MKQCCSISVVLFTASLLANAAHAQKSPETAQSANSFVDSIGVNTHWSYPDTPYGFAYNDVKRLLAESGIRHIRDGINNRLPEIAKLGIHTCVGLSPGSETLEQIKEHVKAINQANPGAIDVIEGPNEPDLFWKNNKTSYKGQGAEQGIDGIIKGTITFQKDLYTVFKSDPQTRQLTIIGPSLGVTYDPGAGHPDPFPPGSLTNFVDWGNFHPYPGGNPFSPPFRYDTIEKYIWHGTNPSGNIDEYPYAFTTYTPPFAPKPMAATETGYSTNLPDGTSELAHGKYMPRLFCEYFRKGIKRTYSYEFVDEFPDPNNREARFGLIRRDLTPKPAYTALKNLISVLDDHPIRRFKPASLDFSLTVSPVGEYTRLQYVHHLLLQKSNGVFYLVVWHEIADEEGSVSPRRPITVPPLPAVLEVKTPIQPRAALYEWDDLGKMTRRAVALNGGKINLMIPDRVMVLELTPPTVRALKPHRSQPSTRQIRRY